MTTIPHPGQLTALTAGEARALCAAHDTDARLLSRKPRHELVAIDRSELAAHGLERLHGGPASKDELIGEILGLRFPAERLNEAIHVLHHRPGESWSACEWCHPHEGQTCECPPRVPVSASATPAVPLCVACVGDRTDPAAGGPCLRCGGTGADPDPGAPRGITPLAVTA